jgi:hypothetical protein
MNGSIRERVEALRREIAELKMLNLANSQKSLTDPCAMSDRERREERLREIMEELRSMTEWKRT